jgi:hypothetical protein
MIETSGAGTVSLAGRQSLAAEILAGRRVAIRIEPATLSFFDPAARELLRTRPNPLTDQPTAGPPPPPTTAPVTAQRRASSTGVIVVCGQRVALGRTHAHRTLTIHVSETTLAIELDDQQIQTVRRTTTKPLRNIKSSRTLRSSVL